MHFSNVLYLAKYFTQSKFFNKKEPILGGIKLTHRCTLKCRQCPYWQRPKPDISWEQLEKLMPELYSHGIRILILEGGEPLLWKDGKRKINDVVMLAKKYFWAVGVTTNGTLPLELDTDIVWVSIDGLQETHDTLRGKSFEKIIANIKASRHQKIFANITINSANYLELKQLVEFLTPLVKGITIQFFYPYEESENLLLTWPQRALAIDTLIELKKAGYPISDSVLALETLKNNTWKCEPWMLANVDPDGSINYGCYLKNRVNASDPCTLCGFAAHTEISLAYQLHPSAIMAGQKILGIF